MHEPLTGILYVIELVLLTINPAPPFRISPDSVIPFALGSAFLLVFAVSHEALRDCGAFSPRIAIVIAACVAALAFVGASPEMRRFYLSLSVVYFFLFRMLDGLMVGVAFGSLCRKILRSNRSSRLHAFEPGAIVLAVTVSGWLLTGVGVLQMLKSTPLFSNNRLAAFAIVGYTICGLLLLPTFENALPYLLYLAVFPMCALLGLFVRPGQGNDS